MAFNSLEDLSGQILPKAVENMAITVCGGDAYGFTEVDFRAAVTNLHPDLWVRVLQPAHAAPP